MRRLLIILGFVVLSTSLSGCIWPGYWHDHGGHRGGGYYRHY